MWLKLLGEIMIYYALGSALITGDELFTPSVQEKITEFTSNLLKTKTSEEITFSNGIMSPQDFTETITTLNTNNQIEFKPIGLCLPLTIMIREVYTGKYPKTNIFSGKKGMLITSAVKSIATFEAKPKAINFLQNEIGSHHRTSRPSASTQGTPIIFYSPALLERALTLDLTMVFDNFPKEIFEQVGNFFSSAAGLPIFLAQSAYLVGAGMLLKLIGDAGEAIFDGNPSFNSSDAIDIFLPGSPPMLPGFALITSGNVDELDQNFRDAYKINSEGKVVDSAGKQYTGDVPYIVISLDGTKSEELESFTPTAASAAVLSKFFGVKNKQEQSLDVLLNALKLYNDFSYRKQIDQLDEKIATTTDKDEKAAFQKKRDALLKNIGENLLKPKT